MARNCTGAEARGARTIGRDPGLIAKMGNEQSKKKVKIAITLNVADISAPIFAIFQNECIFLR